MVIISCKMRNPGFEIFFESGFSDGSLYSLIYPFIYLFIYLFTLYLQSIYNVGIKRYKIAIHV